MKTIIFDIDGTLTDMWPIERLVLLSMLGQESASQIEKLYCSGVKDTYSIFCSISKSKIGKFAYRRVYNENFTLLQSAQRLPFPVKYPLVDFIQQNRLRYRFVYATGGQAGETRYVLERLCLDSIFDFENSIDKSNCRFSKVTGLPFKKIKILFPDCFLITDSENDYKGARLAGVKYIKVKPGEKW